MLAGKALAPPSTLNLLMTKNRTQSAIRTIDYEVKRSQSFVLDASLTDFANMQHSYM